MSLQTCEPRCLQPYQTSGLSMCFGWRCGCLEPMNCGVGHILPVSQTRNGVNRPLNKLSEAQSLLEAQPDYHWLHTVSILRTFNDKHRCRLHKLNSFLRVPKPKLSVRLRLPCVWALRSIKGSDGHLPVQFKGKKSLTYWFQSVLSSSDPSRTAVLVKRHTGNNITFRWERI